jgi:hypothetical protein
MSSEIETLQSLQDEIKFLKTQVFQAHETIANLSKALLKVRPDTPERPPVPKKVLKFYDEKAKIYTPPSPDEIAEYQETCMEILGAVPVEGESING